MQVRCSSYDRHSERLVTIDVSGHVHLWDGVGNGDMRVVRQFQIPHAYKEECTCMMLSDNMLMAGARDAVTIYDPRRPAPILSVPLAKMGYKQAFAVRVNAFRFFYRWPLHHASLCSVPTLLTASQDRSHVRMYDVDVMLNAS